MASYPNRFVVVNGMHASGKTTSAQLLSAYGYLAHGEIGRALRLSMIHNGDRVPLVGRDLNQFDEMILALELRRDRSIAQMPELPHCVETWHVGNLAYASVRSPGLVADFERSFVDQTNLFDPLFVLLTVSESTFHSRSTLQELESRSLFRFYDQIVGAIYEALEKFGCNWVEISNDGDIESLTKKLRKLICGDESLTSDE